VNSSSAWVHRWIFYLASGFMFAAAALRARLVFRDSPLRDQILLLLAAWLVAFIASIFLAHRTMPVSALLIGLEVLIILILLLTTRTDFFAFLFAIPCMQVMQQFSTRGIVAVLGLTSVLTFLSLIRLRGVLDALGIALVYFGGSGLLVVYIAATRRARLIQAHQQVLIGELQQANRQLELVTQQLQQLAAGRERQRLARDLHDSVTQTIFSMTLTTQSALLLLNRDRKQVGAQLERLNALTQSALFEMQVLIARLAPVDLVGRGFVTALQQHLEDRRRLANLSVSLEVEGSQSLEPAEEAGLFGIAQEALNNIVKHARVTEAVLRLHLVEPAWMEVEDRGVGFDLHQAYGRGRVGLESMRERAAEIGWNLQVKASLGNGTCIRVERTPTGGNQA
jgi:signal transduction histidine kinase